MNWLIENVVKSWHPTIMGIMVIASLLYFGLPTVRSNASKSPEDDTEEGLKYSDFEKIKIGMTEEEVERILGVPGKERTPWGKRNQLARS